MINPLFADDDDSRKPQKQDDSYVLPNRHGRKIHPLNTIEATQSAQPVHQSAIHNPLAAATSPAAAASAPKDGNNSNPAVELIRRKLETLYNDEPDSTEEATQVAAEPAPLRSKHQQFMYDLSTSGKSLAQIQTEWHNYYINLSDAEKHQVWQEFYTNNGKQVPGAPAAAVQMPAQAQPAAAQQPAPAAGTLPANPIYAAAAPVAAENMAVVADHLDTTKKEETPKKQPGEKTAKAKKATDKAAKAIKHRITKHVNVSAQTQAKALQHAKSLLFGIGSGVLVLAIVLFGLFNEMVIAPFIQPSSRAGATPIILNSNDVAPTSTPEVIIPKINVEIPVDYTLTNNSEEEVQKGLETGVVHYPTTVHPGEQGNAAFFGHSSNNIFNPGKYKFAFVLLHELAPGDIFYLTYDSKVYTYKVYDKQIVSPSQVEVLNNVEGKTATATLITCDPPGTSLNRLVVWGEQISPDPAGATAPAASQTTQQTTQPQQLTGNGPSLWKRLTGWITGD